MKIFRYASVFLAAMMATSGVLIGVGAGIDASVEFQHAADNESPKDFSPPSGSIITGTWKIIVLAKAASTLESLDVVLEPDQGEGARSVVSKSFVPGEAFEYKLEINWDSTTVTPRNGVYKISATVTSHLQSTETAVLDSLKVNNPPLAPAGVAASMEGSNVRVSWKPNPEPDLISYRILRSADDSRFEPLAAVSRGETSFIDPAPPRGPRLSYRVTAVRYSPLDSEGVASANGTATQVISLQAHKLQGPSLDPAAIRSSSVPAPQPRSVRLPRRDFGFDPLLPYESLPSQTSSTSTRPDFSLATRALPLLSERGALQLARVAASLLLMVGSLHLLRLSRIIAGTARRPG